MWSRDPISTSVALSSVNDFGMVSLEFRKSLLRRSLGDCWKYRWIEEQNYLLGTKKKKKLMMIKISLKSFSRKRCFDNLWKFGYIVPWIIFSNSSRPSINHLPQIITPTPPLLPSFLSFIPPYQVKDWHLG